MTVWFTDPPQTEGLSRERIVAAAVELADGELRGEITMRGLASRLGVRSPMALYRYVTSKDGLADLMADEMYGLVRVVQGSGWRPALRSLGLSAWDTVQAHPWFARLAFSRPPLGPRALDMYEAALTELEPLNLPAAERMGAVSTVLGHAFGSGLALLEERAMRAGTGLTTDQDLDAAAAPYLERVAEAGTHPHVSRWAADPDRLQPAPQGFADVLEWLLTGLAERLDRTGVSGDQSPEPGPDLTPTSHL